MKNNKLARVDFNALARIFTENAPTPLPTNPVSIFLESWKLEKLEKISGHLRNIYENQLAQTRARRDIKITMIHAEDMADLDYDNIQAAKDSLDNSRRSQEADVQGKLLDNEIKREKLEQEKQETRSVTFENDEKIRAMREYLNGTNKA